MLFRQPRMLLSEDSAFSQIGMYGTVLSAIAEGSRTVSGIAQRVGGSTSDVNHRPEWAARLWAESAETFRSQVMGPTFEAMCRVWTEEFASGVTPGGEPDTVSHGVLNDPAGRSQRKLDIVVRDSRRGLVAIGEAMSGEVIGHGHLSQLREAVNLLRAQSHLEPGVQPVLLLFSGAGFTPGLAAEAADSGGTVQLIGLERLYSGL